MVTLQQIARASGHSLATVSYALRNDPRIRPETRARVRKVANALGYRPNPRFSALMAHIRRSCPVVDGERIAFVWVHTSKAESTTDRFLKHVFRGAKGRAEALGYRVEEFWSTESGMTDRRLSQIIKSRGIVGVLLSPVLHEAEVKLDLEWDCFAPAVIGSARWDPELHHAGHHHYLAMRLVLEKLMETGCRRPMAIIESEVNERSRRSWQAAFIAYHPTPAMADELLVMGLPSVPRELARQLRSAQPDALIVSSKGLLDRLAVCGVKIDIPVVVSLHWTPAQPGVGGIDQRYDLIAANAVDLVVSQLNANETGVPLLPRMLLFNGHWIAPKGAPLFPATSHKK